MTSSQEEEKPYWCLKCRRQRASVETKKRAESLKKAPKLKPVPERVSTRQLAKATRRKASSDDEAESIESLNKAENPEENSNKVDASLESDVHQTKRKKTIEKQAKMDSSV